MVHTRVNLECSGVTSANLAEQICHVPTSRLPTYTLPPPFYLHYVSLIAQPVYHLVHP